jgi:cytochrome c5
MQGRRTGKIVLSLLTLVVWIFGAAAVSAAAQAGDQAQIEKGRTAVGQVCAACHNNIARMIQTHRKSADQWKDTVYSMIGRGALILPEEIGPLAAFLAATAGPNSRPAATPALTSPPGPESEGRTILERNCQMCHDVGIATKKQAEETWGAVIAKMMTYGATLTPAEQQKLVEYLNGLAK